MCLWEQSLLAIAVHQSACMLDIPASSRASFAPTAALGEDKKEGSSMPVAVIQMVSQSDVLANLARAR
ncbi:carbon-nitrogen hydrolase, partial [Pseudomonas ogarae]